MERRGAGLTIHRQTDRQTEEQDRALTSLLINSLPNLLRCIILPVIVVVKNGTCHHGNTVVNSCVLLQQGAVEVVPDLCRVG